MYRYTDSLEDIDWEDVKSRLIADDFHNGRTTDQLRVSFENSQHVAIVWADAAGPGESQDAPSPHVIGTARALSDGIGNCYVVDVWTETPHRNQGIASRMMQMLLAAVPGQHMYLQTDDAVAFYRKLGFSGQPVGLSIISGTYLDNTPLR